MYIPKSLGVYSDVFKCIFRRNGNSIPQKREQYSEEKGNVLRRNSLKGKGDAKGDQIKTTGYNVCAERNLPKGHTLIISSALP